MSEKSSKMIWIIDKNFFFSFSSFSAAFVFARQNNEKWFFLLVIENEKNRIQRRYAVDVIFDMNCVLISNSKRHIIFCKKNAFWNRKFFSINDNVSYAKIKIEISLRSFKYVKMKIMSRNIIERFKNVFWFNLSINNRKILKILKA